MLGSENISTTLKLKPHHKVHGQDHSQEQGCVCGQHARDAGHGELHTDKHTDGAESAANGDEQMLESSEAETYRSVVGILMYFKRHRFDLHHAAKPLAMASSSPTKGHLKRLKRVLRYIQGAHDMHLELVRPREQLTEMFGWCDGSCADLDETRRSTTGGLLMLGGACVAGWSRTQKPTALSGGESEFYSANVCACELLWEKP